MSILQRLTALLVELAKNAVPGAGMLLREWTTANALLLYLGENIVLVLLGALTLRLLAPREEVIDGKLKTRRESISTFFLVAIPFSFGAALFTFFILYVADYVVRPRELLTGLALMAGFQLIAFFNDLRALRGITLANAENLLSGILGRVFLLALAVWAGMLLAFFVSTAFVIPFMILKTIIDVWSLRPEALRRRFTAVRSV